MKFVWRHDTNKLLARVTLKPRACSPSEPWISLYQQRYFKSQARRHSTMAMECAAGV